MLNLLQKIKTVSNKKKKNEKRDNQKKKTIKERIT